MQLLHNPRAAAHHTLRTFLSQVKTRPLSVLLVNGEKQLMASPTPTPSRPGSTTPANGLPSIPSSSSLSQVPLPGGREFFMGVRGSSSPQVQSESGAAMSRAGNAPLGSVSSFRSGVISEDRPSGASAAAAAAVPGTPAGKAPGGAQTFSKSVSVSECGSPASVTSRMFGSSSGAASQAPGAAAHVKKSKSSFSSLFKRRKPKEPASSAVSTATV